MSLYGRGYTCSVDQHQRRGPPLMGRYQPLTGSNSAGKKESEKQGKVLAFDEPDTWAPVVFLRPRVPENTSCASPAPLAQGCGTQH